jgi:hypothetical protein
MRRLNMVATSHYVRWKVLSIVLVAVLTVSFGFNLYQSLNDGRNELPNDGNSEAKEFTFYWLPSMQEIINGTLRIEVTTSWNTENFTLIAKVNDKKYEYVWAFLGLVFGSYNGTQILWNCSGLALLCNNYYYSGDKLVFLHTGDFGFALCPPDPSPYHKCTYAEGIGYVFNVSIPRGIVGNSTVMHLYYRGFQYDDITLRCWVAVDFEEWH